jgi:hypothetical protein
MPYRCVGGVAVYIHVLLTSTVIGVKRSNSRFTPGKELLVSIGEEAELAP